MPNPAKCGHSSSPIVTFLVKLDPILPCFNLLSCMLPSLLFFTGESHAWLIDQMMLMLDLDGRAPPVSSWAA